MEDARPPTPDTPRPRAGYHPRTHLPVRSDGGTASHSLGAGCQVSSRGSKSGFHGGSWTGNRPPELLGVTYPACTWNAHWRVREVQW